MGFPGLFPCTYWALKKDNCECFFISAEPLLITHFYKEMGHSFALNSLKWEICKYFNENVRHLWCVKGWNCMMQQNKCKLTKFAWTM